MKKAIFLFCATGAFLCSNAQLTMVKKQPSVTVGDIFENNRAATLKYQVEAPGDTTYTLVYRNGRYEHLDDYQAIVFISKKGEARELYNGFKMLFRDLKSGISEPRIQLELGGKTIIAGTFKTVSESLLLVSLQNSSFHINERQLDRLFGQ